MPILIPDSPVFSTGSERVFWQCLVDQLPDDAAVVTSQCITARTGEVEIDCLVLWPGVGAAVIEVKGGQVSVVDGQWRQSGGHGSRALVPSPVEQVQRAKHELFAWVNSRSSQPLGKAAHMVALPYTTVPTDWDVPDLPRELVLDATDLNDAASRIAAAVDAYGSTRFSPLDGTRRDHTIKLLHRTHSAIEAHRGFAAEIEDEGNALTHEQERIVNLLRFQKRAQIIGGAGSGKTHLAIMKARAMARVGKRTALLCYSRGLARDFQLLSTQWLHAEQPTYVGLFHQLPHEWGEISEDEFDGKASEYYERYLPVRLAELASAQDREQLFDAIIVDEGQDFAELWWDSLRQCLRDPDDGVLYVFSDEHQTVFDRHGSAPITLNPFPLDDNLRNTANIAKTFSPLTPVAQTPRMGYGKPVRFISAYAETAIETADGAVEELLHEGWQPGEIALLTTGKRHPEQVSRIDFDGHDGYWDEFFAAEDVFYGHVLNFKGLERRVVVLAINGFYAPAQASNRLYVGLSRARYLLVVVGSESDLSTAGGSEVLQAITNQ